jgi:hypothetical protein
MILYYCLMATWIGLGDNTELFWAVLSQLHYTTWALGTLEELTCKCLNCFPSFYSIALFAGDVVVP